MLINQKTFGNLKESKFDDIILNQFDEDLDTDADGSELFSLINKSLEHFNQSVHSSNFETFEDKYSNRDFGRDSAYETLVSSLSTQNDLFDEAALGQLKNVSISNKSDNYRLHFKDILNHRKNLIISSNSNQRYLPYGGNSLNQSTSFNEKILRGFPQNLRNSANRQRLQSTSSACDPLTTNLIVNNPNNLSSNSIQAHYSGSPDQNIFQLDLYNSPDSPHILCQGQDLIKNHFPSRIGSNVQKSDIFTQIDLNSNFSQVSKQTQTIRSNKGSGYTLNSPRTYDVNTNTGSRILSPPIATFYPGVNNNKSHHVTNFTASTNTGCGNTKFPISKSIKNSFNNSNILSSQHQQNPVHNSNTPTANSNNLLFSKDLHANNGSNANRLSKSNRACSFYLRGHCKKRDCEFAHDLTQVTCRFWEYGSCLKGSTCPFLHGYPSSMMKSEENHHNDFSISDIDFFQQPQQKICC